MDMNGVDVRWAPIGATTAVGFGVWSYLNAILAPFFDPLLPIVVLLGASIGTTSAGRTNALFEAGATGLFVGVGTLLARLVRWGLVFGLGRYGVVVDPDTMVALVDVFGPQHLFVAAVLGGIAGVGGYYLAGALAGFVTE